MATNWYGDAFPELDEYAKKSGRDASIKALGIGGEGTRENPYTAQGAATPAPPMNSKDTMTMDLHNKLYNAVPQGVFDKVVNLFGPRSARAEGGPSETMPELLSSRTPGMSAFPGAAGETMPYWKTPQGQRMLSNRAIPTTGGARFTQNLLNRREFEDMMTAGAPPFARGSDDNVVDRRMGEGGVYAPKPISEEAGEFRREGMGGPGPTSDEGYNYNLAPLSPLPNMPEAPRFRQDDEMMGMIRDIYKVLSKPYGEDVKGRMGRSMQTVFKGGFIPRHQKSMLEDFSRTAALLSGEESRFREKTYGSEAQLYGQRLGAREQERGTRVREAMLPYDIQKTMAETRRPLVAQGYEGDEHVTREWTPDKGWKELGRGRLPRESMTPQEQLMVHTLGPMLSSYVKAAEESMKPEERQYWLDKASAVETAIFGNRAMPNIAGQVTGAGKLSFDQYKSMVTTKAKSVNQPMPSDDEIRKAYQSRYGK